MAERYTEEEIAEADAEAEDIYRAMLEARATKAEATARKLEIAIMNARADLGRILEDLQKATQS